MSWEFEISDGELSGLGDWLQPSNSQSSETSRHQLPARGEKGLEPPADLRSSDEFYAYRLLKVDHSNAILTYRRARCTGALRRK